MSAPANHWKLGLFVVAGVLLAGGVLIGLGAQQLSKETVTYTTFFDESVQGLEVGSPVKFRGVIIGTVSKISIAEDRRHVAVDSDLVVDDITQMGLGVESGKTTRIEVPPDLRGQLASQGLTGVKFLQIDFFPVESNPPPELPFKTPPNYIPAAMSVMKNLEDSVVNAVNKVPEAADQALMIMRQINEILAELKAKNMPDKLEETLARTNKMLATMERTLQAVDAGKLSADTQKTLADVQVSIGHVNTLLARAAADDGLYASAERASFMVGDAARNASGASRELETTMRAMQDAAGSIQRLTDALERDSDMLLKGRARRASR